MNCKHYYMKTLFKHYESLQKKVRSQAAPFKRLHAMGKIRKEKNLYHMNCQTAIHNRFDNLRFP